ncbi:MAG: DUF2179 domain-containing protein [Anaerolineales bacterium]|nr:DUF2179 domain-containing protein [Anaerolineales bacterium]
MNEFDWYLWVGLPLLVFFARVVDVTLGTLRIIFTARGMKYLAPLLGFVEVFIWVSVIAQITNGAHNVVAYLAYAGGFATGNYIGMFIEDKLAMGMLVIRAIIPEHVKDLTLKLQEKGYGFTSVDAQGSQGPVKLIYTIVQRKNLPEVADIIQRAYPNAFFTVEELRSVERGVFPHPLSSSPQDALFRRKSR